MPSPFQSHVSLDVPENPIRTDQEIHDHEQNFSISQERLAQLVQINNAISLDALVQIANALGTNIDTGIIGDEIDIDFRQREFGYNYKKLEGEENSPIKKCFIELFLEAFKDSTIILLLCCAILSLFIGIKTNGPQEGFTDGAILFLTIFLVVNFSLLFKFLKKWLTSRKLKREKMLVVSVIRSGETKEIPPSDLVVGDIVYLEAGNEVPADGFFFNGDSFRLDNDHHVLEGDTKYTSIFKGSKVAKGNCRMLVTSVGLNTERSKLIEKVIRNNVDQEKEPKLQGEIDKMSSNLEKLWLILCLLILCVQFLRCFLQKSRSDDDDGDKKHNQDYSKSVKNTVEEIMNESTKIMKKQKSGLVSLLCILLFATRDGLPLGILVLGYFSSRNMKKTFGANVQKLPASLTIGLVTSICLSNTNALAFHHSELAEFWIGLNQIFDVSKDVNSQLLKIFRESIAVTSSLNQVKDSLFLWAKEVLGDVDMNEYRNSTILYNESTQVNTNICTSILTNNKVQMLHWKGAPEFILSLCSHFYDVDGTMQILHEENRYFFAKLIKNIGSNSMQWFALAHKQVIVESLEELEHNDDEEETFNINMFHGFTFIALVNLRTPYSPCVKEAVEALRGLDINVKLIVDDDIDKARIMGVSCGILSQGEDVEGSIIEASHFRNSSVEARANMVGNISVMANASPTDKLVMVQCQKKAGEVVAMASSCIRDSPSLLQADAGIFMDNNHKADDADIIVGQSIGTIASIIRSGRYLGKKMETFLQLHLTLNLSAFTLNFILEVMGNNKVQLSPFHLLWTNLIVESLGAFALANLVDPTESQSSPPIYSPIITKMMWMNIAIQSLFQVTILLVLAIKGKYIFHVDENVLSTMIFNCYVLSQVFVLICTIQRNMNTFRGRGIRENYSFFAILVAILVLQVLLVEMMRFVSHWRKLDFKIWLICIGIAAVSVPVGYAAELVSLIMQVIPKVLSYTCI